MKTIDRKKIGIERRQAYRNFIYFTEPDERDKQMRINNQRFVVPWQMAEPEKDKYLVE